MRDRHVARALRAAARHQNLEACEDGAAPIPLRGTRLGWTVARAPRHVDYVQAVTATAYQSGHDQTSDHRRRTWHRARTLSRGTCTCGRDVAGLPPCKAPRGPRGPTSREQAAYKRRSLVDLALIQAALGLRINEALALPADKLTKTAEGIAHRRGHAGGFQDQQRPRRAALRRASWEDGLRAHPSPRRCGAYESR